MTNELTKELVDLVLLEGYRLLAGEEELWPGADEAVVFHDYFIARLVIPCH